MKVMEKSNMMTGRMRGEMTMLKEHRPPVRPIPHHGRKRLQMEFDEQDWSVLMDVFGDEDTAKAAAEIICDAPPEIQVLAIQLLNMIEEVA